MFTKTTPEKPTTERFMDTILKRESCKKHGVPHGVPCFHIEKGRNGYFAGVCNTRARRAGFNHKISEKSLRRNHFQKR